MSDNSDSTSAPDLLPEQVEFAGFQLASGKNVNISMKALAQARHLFKDNEDDLFRNDAFSTEMRHVETEVDDDDGKYDGDETKLKRQGLSSPLSFVPLSSTSFPGFSTMTNTAFGSEKKTNANSSFNTDFSTASGKTVHVSENAMAKAKQRQVNADAQPSLPAPTHEGFQGFSKAAADKVHIPNNAIGKTKQRFMKRETKDETNNGVSPITKAQSISDKIKTGLFKEKTEIENVVEEKRENQDKHLLASVHPVPVTFRSLLVTDGMDYDKSKHCSLTTEEDENDYELSPILQGFSSSSNRMRKLKDSDITEMSPSLSGSETKCELNSSMNRNDALSSLESHTNEWNAEFEESIRLLMEDEEMHGEDNSEWTNNQTVFHGEREAKLCQGESSTTATQQAKEGFDKNGTVSVIASTSASDDSISKNVTQDLKNCKSCRKVSRKFMPPRRVP